MSITYDIKKKLNAQSTLKGDKLDIFHKTNPNIVQNKKYENYKRIIDISALEKSYDLTGTGLISPLGSCSMNIFSTNYLSICNYIFCCLCSRCSLFGVCRGNSNSSN